MLDGPAERRLGSMASAQPIEVEVDAGTLAALLSRTAHQWARLGETDPHWSVLTSDDFRADRIASNADSFYATGREVAGLLKTFEQRNRLTLPRGSCIELGCGVGRITVHLAQQFERVIAIDISPGNLAACEQRLSAEGLTNVQCILVRNLDDFVGLPEADVFVSFIVLQHNSPPVQKEILSSLLPKIAGGCLFQTLTNWPEYRFIAAEYLGYEDDTVMEMHVLPQRVIFDLLAESGFRIREVMSDAWVDHYGSNTFFAVRNRDTSWWRRIASNFQAVERTFAQTARKAE